MSTLGQQLRDLRTKRGLTQDQLAKKLNTTKSAISRYENGQRSPRLEQLMEITQALEATQDELFEICFRSQDVLDNCDNLSSLYWDAVSKNVRAIDGYQVVHYREDEECDEEYDEKNSPFWYLYATDEEIEQKLLGIFSKLDRDHKQNLIEDAEIYLEFQNRREEKHKLLQQDGE